MKCEKSLLLMDMGYNAAAHSAVQLLRMVCLFDYDWSIWDMKLLKGEDRLSHGKHE